ncbi:Rv3654c family TadE-like protein [Nocardia sp. NPDC005366]|uniref:Rv3654c family TadE-like protein n=1 Tax=Nocardia sp. NPDC005366 TaxID=3156878 RepID=UPI0033B49382
MSRWPGAVRTAEPLGPVEAPRSGKSGSDRGGATILGCIAISALMALTLMIAQVGAVVVARHRAQAAADLGALAAAGALAAGAEAGCNEGEEVVRLMHGRMRGCEVADWDAVVSVEENVPIGLLGRRTVHAVARAGPMTDQQ